MHITGAAAQAQGGGGAAGVPQRIVAQLVQAPGPQDPRDRPRRPGELGLRPGRDSRGRGRRRHRQAWHARP